MRVIIGLAIIFGLDACGGGGGPSPPQYFNLGGSVTGLASGASVSLDLSVAGQAQQDLPVTGGSFSFTPLSLSGVETGAVYVVTVSSQPTGQTCSIAHASGTVSNGAGTPLLVSCANNPMLAVLAGDLLGEGSVDGSGTSALFYNPSAIAADALGNLYVADSFNNTIRRVSAAGATTTLAGLAGYSGAVDGTGAIARFNQPAGLTVDQLGNVYVADTYNNTIRKITTGGRVTTLAGSAAVGGNGCLTAADGVGSAATFCYPNGVAVDSAGNVFVADSYNHSIRKVTPNGTVSTFAGSAAFGLKDGTGNAAVFDVPIAITIDGMDNLYVSDDDTIREVTPSAVVTTIAGLNVQVGSADGTGTNARFFLPQGLAAASDGTVYIADTGANAIRVMTPARLVTTLAGTLNSPGGNADGTGTAASFRLPSGITLSPYGNLYVADATNKDIRKVTLAGAVTTIAGTAPAFGLVNGSGTAARFYQPQGATTDSSGNLYVADSRNRAVRKITPQGLVSTLLLTDGTGNPVPFEYITGIAVDASGKLYLADTSYCTISKFSSTGTLIRVFGGAFGSVLRCGLQDGTPGSFNEPTGLAADSSDNFYVADSGNNAIRKISAQGSVTTVASGANAGLSRPTDVALGAGGAIYVVDSDNHAIRVISSAGSVTTLAGHVGVAGSAEWHRDGCNVQLPPGDCRRSQWEPVRC
jgi:sugar lactone lactonase YvrE